VLAVCLCVFSNLSNTSFEVLIVVFPRTQLFLAVAKSQWVRSSRSFEEYGAFVLKIQEVQL